MFHCFRALSSAKVSNAIKGSLSESLRHHGLESQCRARISPLWAMCLSALLILGFSANAYATTYYVDSVSGSDTNSGTSTMTPWKTLTKVNGVTFVAGDSILFHAGGTWAGQLHPLGSGSSAAPITISSYSTGAMPIINGASLSGGGAVYLSNQSYWTIENLEVTSNSGVNNFGTLTTTGVNRSGILVDNESGTILSGITIQHNYVHDVNGCFNCSGYDAHMNGGIIVVADGGTLLGFLGLAYSSYSNVYIGYNTVSNVGRTGITFYDNSAGVYTSTIDSYLSTGVTVQGNSVSNVDSDGIIVSGTLAGLIDHNVVANAGQKTIDGSTEPASAGLWPTRSDRAVVQYNEVYGTLTHFTDGEGFDVDAGSINTIVQYNYSHDNQGGFLVMEDAGSSNLIVRYNLSVNDSYGGVKGVFTFSDSGVVPNTLIYNNTVYIASGLPSQPIYCDSCGTNPSGTYSFENNVIVNFGSGSYLVPTPSGGGVISHNLFYGNHPATEPSDSFKLTSDPNMISPSATAPIGLGSVSGYQVSSSSPAVGSGVTVTSNGGQDYFGRPVSATSAPTRGFFEEQTF